MPYVPLHPVSRSSDLVYYRDGQEFLDSDAGRPKTGESKSAGLSTSGAFGPILGTTLVDASQGNLIWSHWEQGAKGPVATFRFSVPRQKSHYQVEFCCVSAVGQSPLFHQFSGYHGEIAVDPANGTILRLVLIADLAKSDPMVKSDIMVEYGPVQIGEETYICPTRSVAISLAPAQSLRSVQMQRMRSTMVEQENAETRAPLQTMLNEVAFEQFHLFRAEARILAADNPEPPANSALPASVVAPAAPSAPPAPPAETHDSAAPPAPDLASVPPAAPAPPVAEEAPEMSVATATSLPDTPAVPRPESQETEFTLRVTARLVDLGVVALDKKGLPVTDLKPDDFEIYDNGRKQKVRFFSQAGTPAVEPLADPGQSSPSPVQPVFSNRREVVTDAKPASGEAEGSVTILLIDANSMAWADLTYSRDQMLKFLRTLPSAERVGLYVEGAKGFQVLVEATADHALVASSLRQWAPTAQELARTQDLEQRNRQQFDYVQNASDLQYVNGNMNTTPDTASPVDPQLRDNGGNPARGAMLILVGVARHLAAIPGHKSLVWVASDNVLADFTDKAVASDKGSKHNEGFVLRAQEALNDAHVSVYPLDASQLETMAIDPSLSNASVELSPSVTAPPQPHMGGSSPGRTSAEMQQDLHPIQAPIQEMARATGGHVFPRSGDIAAHLSSVVQDGRATYLLGFTPDSPADDQYHLLTVRLTARRGVTLRYRTGYQYAKDPATLKDRFRQAIWQPDDMREIAVTARPTPASNGFVLKLSVATSDIDLTQSGDFRDGKLDIFLVRRDDTGLHAQVAGQTLGLRLKPATYDRLLRDGVPFEEFVEKDQSVGSLRIVVVDENSRRMGSVTLPAAVLEGKH
jgi:VWFA-related protein